jgi:hypothetical protein
MDRVHKPSDFEEYIPLDLRVRHWETYMQTTEKEGRIVGAFKIRWMRETGSTACRDEGKCLGQTQMKRTKYSGHVSVGCRTV